MSAESDDRAFDTIRLGTQAPSACSPVMGRDERGFRIAAPRRVALAAAARIPVCATYQFGRERRDLPGDLWGDVVIVAVDVTHNRAWAMRLRPAELGEPPPEPEEGDAPPTRAPEEFPNAPMKGGAREFGHINLDAGKVLRLPAQPAIYYIHLTYAGYQSNTVRVAAAA